MKRMLLLLVLLTAFRSFAQDRAAIKSGNDLYREGLFEKAAQQYQQALEKNNTNYKSAFNLGNALYQQKKYEDARTALELAGNLASGKVAQANAYYNAGNTYMAEEKWDKAIENYKETLRRNPDDEDARYNLSYALKKKKQDEQNNSDNKQEEDEQPKENKPDSSPNNDDSKNNKKDEPKQDKPEPLPSKLTKKQAERLLQALQQEEKKVQERRNEGQASPPSNEKDW